LAAILLERGGDSFRADVLAFVRELHLDAREACLVRLVEEPDFLPVSYLSGLLEGDPKASERLAAEVSALLCRFVRETAGVPAAEGRRVAALGHLRTFRSDEACELLESILRARRLPFLPKESPAIRRAARATLQVFEFGRVS
jgi:hypothetical protein